MTADVDQAIEEAVGSALTLDPDITSTFAPAFVASLASRGYSVAVQAEVARLTARVAELEKAAGPFVKMAKLIDPMWADNQTLYVMWADDWNHAHVGDLRDLAAAAKGDR